MMKRFDFDRNKWALLVNLSERYNATVRQRCERVQVSRSRSDANHAIANKRHRLEVVGLCPKQYIMTDPKLAHKQYHFQFELDRPQSGDTINTIRMRLDSENGFDYVKVMKSGDIKIRNLNRLITKSSVCASRHSDTHCSDIVSTIFQNKTKYESIESTREIANQLYSDARKYFSNLTNDFYSRRNKYSSLFRIVDAANTSG